MTQGLEAVDRCTQAQLQDPSVWPHLSPSRPLFGISGGFCVSAPQMHLSLSVHLILFPSPPLFLQQANGLKGVGWGVGCGDMGTS